MTNENDVIPKVKFTSGKDISGCRLWIDGKELLTVTSVDIHGERGSLIELTVKFGAVIEEASEQPKEWLNGLGSTAHIGGHYQLYNVPNNFDTKC
jgi:hypothetical protein